MEYFQPRAGFVHRVVAQENDSYLLGSLLRADLEEYLFSLLRAQGYEGIFFLKASPEALRLQVCDGESGELYRRLGRKAKGFLGLFGPEEDPDAREFPLAGEADCLRCMQTMMKKGPAQAFVLSQGLYPRLQERQPQELRELLRTVGKKSILIRVETQPGEDPALALDGTCREQLLRMATRALLTTRFDWDWGQATAQALADFLQAWQESPALRQELGAVLPENPEGRLDVLMNSLQEPGVWLRLLPALDTWQQRNL